MGSFNDGVPELEQCLLQDERNKQYTGDGSVDFRGKPAIKHDTGNWRACPFILGNECCERLAFFGISTNLVTYLTTKLHEGNVSAARNVGVWQGTCYLTPLIGAVLADGYWGRYWTIAIFSMIYFLGMSILTISASLPSLKPAECLGSVCPPASPLQYYLLYFGLYVIALGTGGVKACVSSFGADQFDDTDSKERARKASFFNWYYFSIMLGATVSCSFIVWVQDNAGWGLGFAIPALFMGLSVGSFFLGTSLYSSLLYEIPDKKSGVEGSRKLMHRDDLRYFDRATVVSDSENRSGDYSNPWRLCTVSQVEELKILIRMIPIWATGIIFSAVYAQMSTRNYDGYKSAIVEIKRLQLTRKLDLIDKPVAIPLGRTATPEFFIWELLELFHAYYSNLFHYTSILNMLTYIIAAKMYKQKKIS
ncbi:unnamed protein product [Vicia faba]|uniref:Uncharacterized protein n=1 Tax=Vicia faba TaxID=3906 RepID=A0AAV1B4P8_VICFA|nr:unnamed protein product [Vicia faba]